MMLDTGIGTGKNGRACRSALTAYPSHDGLTVGGSGLNIRRNLEAEHYHIVRAIDLVFTESEMTASVQTWAARLRRG
jgi:hypothetical protein